MNLTYYGAVYVDRTRECLQQQSQLDVITSSEYCHKCSSYMQADAHTEYGCLIEGADRDDLTVFISSFSFKRVRPVTNKSAFFKNCK